MKVIEVNHVTKDYGRNKGVFDISFEVLKGQTVGFLGPNGSGKTTTIRQLMGFIRPDLGNVSILGMDCFEKAAEVQKQLGYLPGEIALMDEMTGIQFITFMAKMRGISDMQKAHALISFLELDPHIKIKRMSKGMKQKVGLVIAFMEDAPILILDEPTSGLDPLMQNKFVTLIQKAKEQGKTILMSSHIFEEVENTCDRIIMIKNGKIIADQTMEDIKNNQRKRCVVKFKREEEAIHFSTSISQAQIKDKTLSFYWAKEMDALIKKLSQYEIEDLTVSSLTLEELFLHYYGGENHDQGLDA